MRRLGLLAAGLLALGIAGVSALWRTVPPPPVAGTAPPPTPAPRPVPLVAPSFDVVRIGRAGEAVMAGRAAPGAEVVVLDGGAEIGRVAADRRGEWVFVPGERLMPGARELTLRAVDPQGRHSEAAASVILSVPATDSAPALAVRIGPEGGDVLAGIPPSPNAPRVTVASLTQLRSEGLYVAGSAPAGSRLRVYYDNLHLGTVLTDPDGRWRIAARLAVEPGRHAVRADQIGVDGVVGARAEVAMERGTAEAAASITIDRADDHWRITRRVGGASESTVVFRADAAQARDPAVVYPGQVMGRD